MNYFITQFTNLLTYLAHKMTDKCFAFSNQIALLPIQKYKTVSFAIRYHKPCFLNTDQKRHRKYHRGQQQVIKAVFTAVPKNRDLTCAKVNWHLCILMTAVKQIAPSEMFWL